MKAAISGAGIAGLALAHRLDTLGWEVVVLEKAPGPRAQGYMIDFFGPGYDAVEAMGVLPRLRELAYEVTEAVYLDETGRRRVGVSYTQFARAVRGRVLSIMRPDLVQGLREQLGDRVDLRFATTLTDIDQHAHGVHLGLSDGGTLDADLLVGADGVHSAVRGMVFGEEDRYLRYLGFHTAAFAFDAPDLRAEIGDRFCLTDTVEKVLGCYGLRDGRVAVFTVHRTPDPTLPQDARAAVRRVYSSLGWIVPTALDRCPPPEQVYYDQVAQIEIPAWSRGRVTLVGDACQAVSLLAGQGASLGIAGAYVLAEQLARTDSVEDGLARYEQLWRPVVVEKQRVARKGARWFLPESPTQLRVRRAAMKLARVPGIDRFVAGSVTGKSIAVVQQLHATGRDLNRTGTP